MKFRKQLAQRLKSNFRLGIFLDDTRDSLLLAHICLKILAEDNLDTELKFFTVPQTDTSIPNAQTFLDSMNAQYGTNHVIISVGESHRGESRQVANGLYSAFKHADFVFMSRYEPSRLETSKLIYPFDGMTVEQIDKLAVSFKFV